MHHSQKGLILFMFLWWQVSRAFCEGNCPNATAILPCYCEDHADNDVRIYCSNATTEDEIEKAFITEFPITNLTSFHIEYNSLLTQLSRNLFVLVNFQQIIIQFTEISFIDPSFFNNCYRTVTDIELFSNSFSDFPFDALPRFTKLSSLILSNNYLTSLPRISSSSITDLTILYNDIEILDDFVFIDCTKLKSVYLWYNLISEIPVSSFIGVESIEYIGLQGNLIEVVRTGTFTALPNLEQIDFGGNPLASIEDAAFVDLPNLRDLSTGFTKMTSFRSEIFFEVFNIDDFDGGNSLVETIEPYTFSEFHQNSINIYLSGNSLTAIAENAFAGVSGSVIQLTNNNISVVEIGAFTDLKNSSIYLGENFITTLDESWLRPIFEANNSVNFNYNPLECGCDMAWIVSSADFFNKVLGTPLCANGSYVINLNFDYYKNNC